MNKRVISVAVALVCLLPLFGCRRIVEEAPKNKNAVLASFYPIYALMQGIIADVPSMDMRCLVQPQDGCPRNYMLSEWDASLLSASDIVVLGGRGLESFETYLTNLGENGPVLITAMSGLELRGEGEAVPQDQEEADHGIGPNPWLFLSVQGARDICEALCANMIYIDRDNEEVYLRNLEKMQARLDALLEDMRSALEGAKSSPVALMHEGAQYLADELGLDVRATIPREPGQDYELDALEQVLGELKEADVRIVLIEKQAPTRLKRELSQAGLVIAEIDTVQTQMPDGTPDGYFEAMRRNAEALRAALDRAEPHA